MHRRMVFALALGLGLAGWFCLRTGTAAHAATPIDVVAAEDDDEADGNFDDASRRWTTSQPRHWRHIVLKR